MRLFAALLLACGVVAATPALAMDEPKTVAFDKLPKDIKALHKCATAEHSLEVAFEPYARLVVFFVTCPAARGALTPYAVYVARDSKGTAAKRIKFEALAADGSTTTLDTLFSATPAREAYTKPDDPQPNLSSKNDVAWITGAWGPEDRPGVCAVAAIWRLQGDKAEVRFWEEAKECPKGETPKYETKLDKKPPPLVAP